MGFVDQRILIDFRESSSSQSSNQAVFRFLLAERNDLDVVPIEQIFHGLRGLFARARKEMNIDVFGDVN